MYGITSRSIEHFPRPKKFSFSFFVVGKYLTSNIVAHCASGCNIYLSFVVSENITNRMARIYIFLSPLYQDASDVRCVAC